MAVKAVSLSPRRKCDDVVGGLALEPFGVGLHHRASSLDRRLSPICAFDSAEGMRERRLSKIAIDTRRSPQASRKIDRHECGVPASTPAFPGAVAKGS